MNGDERGREPSAAGVPRKVSENNHSIRPSGSRTEAVRSAPSHRPEVSP